MNTLAYIGLGSNQDAPLDQLKQAIDSLNNDSNIRVNVCAPFYQSAPIGPQDQPDYINSVVEVTTDYSPHELLNCLHAIEAAQGRNRDKERRWGERSLDLDILLYDTLEIDDESVTIPHPRLLERAFVVYPLLDIAPNLVIPSKGRLSELKAHCANQKIVKK